MIANIPIGLKGDQSEKVTAKNTAIFFGSGSLEVYATPAMITLMELCCKNSIADILPGGFTSVGSEVHVKHLKPSAVGNSIHCESQVVGVEGRKITFEVSTWDDQLLIGHGTHIRYIVEVAKFMSQL